MEIRRATKNDALTLSKLNVDAIEAEVIWGEDIQSLLKPIGMQIADLNHSLSTYIRGLDQSSRRRISDETFERAEKTVYGWFDPENDEYSQQLRSNTERIVDYLRPFLK